MEDDGQGDGGGDALPPIFGRAVPQDAAEYMLFVLGSEAVTTTQKTQKPRARLDQVRKAALKLAGDLTKDYIWQRDAFNLEIVSRDGMLYLHGVTGYGDCVEDEWLVVYMLRELSRSFSDVWIRVGDSDGEFLLVEAAKAVPKWLNPEMDANRVWIHDGHLKIIPVHAPPGIDTSTSTTACKWPPPRPALKLTDAVRLIKVAPGAPICLPDLEAEAFHRLQKYPGYVATSMHYARLVLPRRAAFVLHDRPRSIAPAVEAFVARDPEATRRALGAGSDQPEARLFTLDDLVVCSVRFTRVLYAQLRGQRFTPPRGWPDAFASAARVAEAAAGQKDSDRRAQGATSLPPMRAAAREIAVDLGMKLTCGLALMAADAATSNNRLVREVGLILADLAEDGDDAAALPSDEEMCLWKETGREDDDAWFNIDFADFERELDGDLKAKEAAGAAAAAPAVGSSATASGFGDSGVQTDLRRIVSQFQAFLNDEEAGIEGAEFDEMDVDDDDDDDDDDESEDDDNVDFDEATFSRLMREMMGLSPSDEASTIDVVTTGEAARPNETAAAGKGPDAAMPAGRVVATRDLNAGPDNDEDGILALAAQFEAELKGHGALKLNVSETGKNKKKIKPGEPSTKSITAAGDTVSPAPADGSASNNNNDDSDGDDYDDDDDDSEVDVDFTLAKNLLESFKGQHGMPGPAGNMLSMLGLALPRDEDDEDADEKADAGKG